MLLALAVITSALTMNAMAVDQLESSKAGDGHKTPYRASYLYI
jgi:hypothetical protein